MTVYALLIRGTIHELFKSQEAATKAARKLTKGYGVEATIERYWLNE